MGCRVDQRGRGPRRGLRFGERHAGGRHLGLGGHNAFALQKPLERNRGFERIVFAAHTLKLPQHRLPRFALLACRHLAGKFPSLVNGAKDAAPMAKGNFGIDCEAWHAGITIKAPRRFPTCGDIFSALQQGGAEALARVLPLSPRRLDRYKQRRHKGTAMDVSPFDKARILSEALPHMQRYDEATIVVKYGGHAMGEEQLARDFARDIVLLEQLAINPVVVHGGGPQIGAMLKKLGIESHFAGGLRITDAKTVEVVEMVLAGSINKQLVGFINDAGGKGIGLSGKDGDMVRARKLTRHVVDPNSSHGEFVDLGFVGEPDILDMTVLNEILGRKIIPVLAPIAGGPDGVTYNINADTFAGAIAGALHAKRLIFLTDVPGVLDKSGKLIAEMTADDVRRLIADGTISGGMIPKVETCIEALDLGVEGVVIMDGKVPHAVLLELLTDHGAGTLIRR